MGSISEIFNGVLNFFNSLIGTGSAAAEGVYGTITGSLGNVVDAV